MGIQLETFIGYPTSLERFCLIIINMNLEEF